MTASLGEDLQRDLRYALRMLARAPAFTIVAVLALGLGIGATTSIFTVVHSVLLQPLPYRDSDRLVRIVEHVPAGRASRVSRNASPRWRRTNSSSGAPA